MAGEDNVKEMQDTVEVEPVGNAEPAREVQPDPNTAPVGPAYAGKAASGTISTNLAAWIAAIALIIGLVAGMFAFNAAPSSHNGVLSGKTAVSENELDTVIATYSGSAGSGEITVRDALLQQGSLTTARTADGQYALPPAETILALVRNDIILADASQRGITATDEEVKNYAESSLGTSDYAAIGQNYGMDENMVKELMANSCIMTKLRDEIAPVAASAPPAAPAEPEAADGAAPDTKARTQEYAEYIIALVGDEWDAEKDTWASTDGTYASMLSDFEISAKDGASYEAAQMAYYAAYSLYSQQANQTSGAWADYVNGLFSNSTITINSLVA